MFPPSSSRKAKLIVESAVLQRFNRYAEDLVEWARAHPLVTGLVFFGSSADRSRVDEWSDHDFAVVVATGDQETLRGDVGWLPRSAEIVTSARQHHDGFIAFYRDGSVVEFAVVDTTELGTFLAHPWSIAYDEGGVAEVMSRIAAAPRAAIVPGLDVSVFLAILLVGVGRARRGETLSASGSVRGLALDHLLIALHSQSFPETHLRDSLDPRRRFELIHPELGRRLGAALAKDVEGCARELLAIAEQHLAVNADAIGAVKGRLGWG
jgi:hypothetical protein